MIVAETGPFAERFSIGPGIRVIALVGAGGKTSLMYALARELASSRTPVVTTTTTKIHPPSLDESPGLLLQSDEPLLQSLPELLRTFGHVTIARSLISDIGKLEAVSEATVELCMKHARFVLVEADGASGRPIKAPEPWEPVIPRCANLVIPVVGMDCLGKPATSEWVFRVDRFSSVTGIRKGEIIGPRAVARLLTHPDGGLKRVPPGAAVIPFLNVKGGAVNQVALAEIASSVETMGGGKISRIVAGSARETMGGESPLVPKV